MEEEQRPALHLDTKHDGEAHEPAKQQEEHYALPSPEVLREIATKQDAKAKELKEKRRQKTFDEKDHAARLIQKNYRGYRTRRAMKGYGLDPSTRWVEV
jgi:hypothetical protein